MGTLKRHGITADTPKNIPFGAGTFYKNLTYSGSAWSGDILGATSGGGKVSIAGEYVEIELDGALVKVKGLTVKQGGTATMELNFAELNADILKMTTHFEEGTSDATGFTMFKDKANLTNGDYLENLGYVGKTADGSKDIIVIFETAICTSGFELEGKNKENSVIKATFDAAADIEGDLETLPVKIYYPSATTL